MIVYALPGRILGTDTEFFYMIKHLQGWLYWSKRTCCRAVRQRLSWPGEEVTARSLTHRGITERGLAVQEQLAYRTVCMRQRHRVSSESPPNAAIPEGVPTYLPTYRLVPVAMMMMMVMMVASSGGLQKRPPGYRTFQLLPS